MDKNAKKNPNVVESWHYVEKIWKKDIPLLLSNNGDFEDKNKILKTTIIAIAASYFFHQVTLALATQNFCFAVSSIFSSYT